jgi:hypothetical protein
VNYSSLTPDIYKKGIYCLSRTKEGESERKGCSTTSLTGVQYIRRGEADEKE